MSISAPNSRFEAALAAPESSGALRKLAHDLKAEGMGQREMYDLFTHYLRMHNGAEDPLSDPIADTMDIISGWCSHGWLFDTFLDGTQRQ